ncbi:PLAC8 family-domain-containing protein [Aspergillus filifer]
MALNSNLWDHSLFHCFTPFSVCLGATFLPCCLFNRIGARFRGKEVKGCGQDCCLFAGACCLGIQCIPLCLRRRAIRKQFQLDGNCCGDTMASLCCSCCVLSQLDHEVKREADTTQVGYQPPAAMIYGH